MISHVDHPEHHVDLLITEQGLADLRGKAPRERALTIIDNRVHVMYRNLLSDYSKEALARGSHAPHVLEKAFSWRERFKIAGSMQSTGAAGVTKIKVCALRWIGSATK